MERIDPIRRPLDGTPSVERAAVGRRVERRDPGEEGDRRRRRPAPQQPDVAEAPDARPDADGHIDISV